VYKNQKYNYVNAPGIRTLFPNGVFKKIEIKNEWTGSKNNRGAKVKDPFIRAIFMDFLKIVVQDCIERNVKFIAPVLGSFSIFISEKSKEAVRRDLNAKGIYENVDPIASEFRIYQFSVKNRNAKRLFWPVRISNNIYSQIVDRVNKGQKYLRRVKY
jgi:hypothetical protein